MYSWYNNPDKDLEKENYMNTATIIGRAGQDAEIKYFESGKSKTTFSLAGGRWDSKTKEEVTDWFNVEVWDKQAEFAAVRMRSGSVPSWSFAIITRSLWIS